MRQWVCSQEVDGVRMMRGSDLEPRAVDWLWKYWLPRGAISILAGTPGTGKTSLALALAAVVSTGSEWPDGSVCLRPGQVVIWSGEDDIQATLLPRLIGMKADLSRIHFVTTIQEQGRLREFDPALDMRQLMFKICEVGEVDLVVLDPLISVVAGDTNKAVDVRDSLQDLIILANSGLSIVGITHFSKGSKASSPLDRVLGSQAFSAVARVVLVTVKQPDNDGRLLLRAKSNLGPDGNGFSYRVQPKLIESDIESSVIVWGERVDGDVDALMRGAEDVLWSNLNGHFDRVFSPRQGT